MTKKNLKPQQAAPVQRDKPQQAAPASQREEQREGNGMKKRLLVSDSYSL